jgi:predicted NAD-dependent protein-ADP-ribosyltransferase YbiA (DUF1768 family)
MNIVIPKPTDKKYGYLSNDSKHGFMEDSYGENVYWPSVTHYIEAKKFEGTQWENEIRKARTVLQAKRMARERVVNIKSYTNSVYNTGDKLSLCNDYGSLEITKKKVYGYSSRFARENAPDIKSGWNKLVTGYLKTAIRLKFTQNRNLIPLLLSTYPDKIICENIENSKNDFNNINTVSARLIMQLRDDHIAKNNLKNQCILTLCTSKNIENQNIGKLTKDPVISLKSVKRKKLQNLQLPTSTDLKIEIFEDYKLIKIRDSIIKLFYELSKNKIHSKFIDASILKIYPHKSIINKIKIISKLFNSEGPINDDVDDAEILRKYLAITKKIFIDFGTDTDKYKNSINKCCKKITSFVVLCEHFPKIKNISYKNVKII